jgi:hypothetical protein
MTRSDLDDRDGDRQWSQSEKIQIYPRPPR